MQQVESNAPIVDAYIEAVDAKRSDQDITDRVLAVTPAHAEAAEVTAAIREKLKERGTVGAEDHQVQVLVPLHWTEAERADIERFERTEVAQYHRNGGSFKAGAQFPISDFKTGQTLGPGSTYAVYTPAIINITKGERIRITANGMTADKKHKLNNGAQYTVAGIEGDGKIRLMNGWFLAPEFKKFIHGYVTTSHASQGKTVDTVFIAMGQESVAAIGAEGAACRSRAAATRRRSSPMLRQKLSAMPCRKQASESQQRNSTTASETSPGKLHAVESTIRMEHACEETTPMLHRI